MYKNYITIEHVYIHVATLNINSYTQAGPYIHVQSDSIDKKLEGVGWPENILWKCVRVL